MTRIKNKSIFIVLILLLVSTTVSACTATKKNPSHGTNQAGPVALTIAAASSLTEPMNEIQKLYRKSRSNVTLTINSGGSGGLEQQIEQGAPVDLYIAAANTHMDALARKDLLVRDTRQVLLKNKLVLIAPRDSQTVKDFESLKQPQVKIIACGDPALVPAGKYASETLNKLGLLFPLKDKFILGKDVKQVLTYVESGDADAGFVYATDAMASKGVTIVATTDDKTHSPIVYPVAVIKSSKNIDAARDFEDFLRGPQAQAVFSRFGFIMVNKNTPAGKL